MWCQATRCSGKAVVRRRGAQAPGSGQMMLAKRNELAPDTHQEPCTLARVASGPFPAFACEGVVEG